MGGATHGEVTEGQIDRWTVVEGAQMPKNRSAVALASAARSLASGIRDLPGHPGPRLLCRFETIWCAWCIS